MKIVNAGIDEDVISGERPIQESSMFISKLIIYKKDEQFGKWKIANCSAKMKAYTCRKPSDGKTWGTPAPVDDSEGTDFPHKFEQHQYVVMYVAEKVNFLQARLKCEDMNANLASLHSRGEIEFLKSVMQSNSTLMEDAWIGMVYNVTDTNAHTTWIDGSSYDYRYTAPGEPKYLGKGEYCGQACCFKR
ncbi:lectin C-type domain protein [Ancylostoma caninum]|uniref:Lectin C-type domain protein n=1 Tax=Ancylostoma caninum TaxID=29170 RepID=A0A368G1W4_ANCCA|nr:lectin C-type domain protein [Ancylostoma caninum]